MNNEKLIPIGRYEFASASASCDIFKKFDDIEVISAKTTAYDNAIGMMDIIDAVCFEKTESIEDMFELASQVTGYEEEISNDDEFSAENEALKAKTEKKAFRYKRYCRAELAKDRVNYAPMFPMLDINIGGIYVIAYKPQALFIDRNRITGQVNIEAVHYADKKAVSGLTDAADIVSEVEDYDNAMAKKGISVDPLSRDRLGHVSLWRDEYLNIKYIETLIDTYQNFWNVAKIQKGDKVEAIGSVYYMEMKSNDDKEADFWNGNSNILRLEEMYIAGEDNLSHSTTLDDIFRDYAQMHVLGMPAEKCTKQDCEYCTKSASCRFQKAPVKREKVEVKSNAKGDFAPTPSQQELIALADVV